MNRHPLILFLAVALCTACSREGADPHTPQAPSEPNPGPNILLIVADDLGFSDLGAFGGEISTPNLDRLAREGAMLTNHHTSLTCSPTRAMFLSGVDSHRAGLGNMAETVADNQLGLPGYEGYLNHEFPTLATLIGAAGYRTYIAGKWHLGMQPDQAPVNRGFDRSFVLLHGGASHFDDMTGPDEFRPVALYRENGGLLERLPDDFYSTRSYTDWLIDQIGRESNAPFFAYLAYTAPHWPLQVPDDYLDRYRGAYDAGYDAIRDRRVEKLNRMGLFDAVTLPSIRPEPLRPWDALTDEERRSNVRNMELYAAMVDYMDMSIGRILRHLERTKQLDNTIIVFFSDNGAEAWSESFGPPGWTPGRFSARFDNSLENRGRRDSFVFYSLEWAHVSNAPFSHYKGHSGEGGIRTPAIVRWPGHVEPGGVHNALTFVTDWYTTLLAAAGTEGIAGSTGRDLLPLLAGDVDTVRRPGDVVGVEIWGVRGLIDGDDKIINLPPPRGSGEWMLYDLAADPSEQVDLASENTERLDAMRSKWDTFASDNNVVLPEGPLKVRPPESVPKE